MRKVILALGLAACGGGPALQNVPHPDTSTAAGIAAAAAVAATLADPSLNRTPEKKTAPPSNRPIASGRTVPSDVLDRLDDQPTKPAPAEPEVTAEEVEDAPPLPPPVIPQP